MAIEPSTPAAQRIMMQLGATARPLGFVAEGGDAPLIHGAAAGWAGVPIEVHRMASWEGNIESGPMDGERGLLLYLAGEVEILAQIGGRDVVHTYREGSATLLTGDQRPRVLRIRGNAEVAAIHLPSAWTARAIGEHGTGALARPAVLGRDDTLHALARQMLSEIDRGGGAGRLFAESLSLALVSYLLHRLPGSPAPARQRCLTPFECRRLRQFIDERLREDISISDLAAVVGLRPRHFSTLFRRSFGCTPYRFVLDQRLAEGARRLAASNQDIAEIAYDLGFSSQSHFTTSFRRGYGVTPGRYAIGKS